MFAAYSAAIQLNLVNNVSAGLASLIKQFRAAETSVVGLRKELLAIDRLSQVGGSLTDAGSGVFDALGKAADAARDYGRQLAALNAAGLTHAEIAQSVSAAWRTTGAVTTTTVSDNLKAIAELRGIFGDTQDAIGALPAVAEFGAAMSMSADPGIREHSQHLAVAMASALNTASAGYDPAKFEREAGLMSKVVTAFGDRISPQQLQRVFEYADQADLKLSDRFKYEFLPSLMRESPSSGPERLDSTVAALSRFASQGQVDTRALPILARLGLLTSPAFAKSGTPDAVGAQLRGRDLAAQNPFQWSQEVLMPAVMKMLGPKATQQRIREVIRQAFAGCTLTATAMVQFASKPQNFLRDQRAIQGATSYQQAYQQALKNDPELAMVALRAQWRNFITTIGIQVLPDLMTVVKSLVPVIHDLAMWSEKNPDGVRAWVRGFEALGAVLTVGGPVVILAAFARAFGPLFRVLGGGALLRTLFGAGPVGGLLTPGIEALGTAIGGVSIFELTALTGGIALLGIAVYEAWQHWDSSKSIFSNLRTEIGGFLDWAKSKVDSHPQIAASVGAALPFLIPTELFLHFKDKINAYFYEAYTKPALDFFSQTGDFFTSFWASFKSGIAGNMAPWFQLADQFSAYLHKALPQLFPSKAQVAANDANERRAKAFADHAEAIKYAAQVKRDLDIVRKDQALIAAGGSPGWGKGAGAAAGSYTANLIGLAASPFTAAISLFTSHTTNANTALNNLGGPGGSVHRFNAALDTVTAKLNAIQVPANSNQPKSISGHSLNPPGGLSRPDNTTQSPRVGNRYRR